MGEESAIQISAVEQIEHLFTIRWPEWMIPTEDKKLGTVLKSPLFAVPNGGNRNIVTAVTMKREGQKRGVWDLTLEIPRGGFPMLKIEVKTQKGRLSKSQKAWGEFYDKIGAKKVVCRSTSEIVDAVIDYMELK